MDNNIEMSLCRLHGISCALHGLSGGIFENNIDGLLSKKVVSFSGIPESYINAFDWINANYELLQYLVEELSYTIEEQTNIIEKNINDQL